MRICLINPPRIQPKSWGKPNVYQPIGIASVAAVLEKHHEVTIIDAPTEGRKNLQQIGEKRYRVGLSSSDIVDKIQRGSPDLVGIKIPFSGWSKAAFEISSAVKSVDQNIITVLHGQHPSARPLDCLARTDIDLVAIGEEDLTFSELAEVLEHGKTKDLRDVKGIAFTKDDKEMVTPTRPLIEDLDSLPFPARHLLPMKEYFAAVREYPLRGEISKPWTTVITSRGCPHQCVFCSVHNVRGRKWRARSPQNVIREIEQLIETYGIQQIDFHDDNLTLDKRRMEQICDLIVQKKLDIEWYAPNGVRADTLDKQLLIKMRRSGCQRIKIAPESGVQRVVNNVIQKNLDLKTVEKAVSLCKEVGIGVGCFFVLGLIGETKEDIKQTINYAKKLKRLGADRFYFSVATPLYGTELYSQAYDKGCLIDNFKGESLSMGEPVIETPDFSIEDIRQLCAEANLVNRTSPLNRFKAFLNSPKKTLLTWVQHISS